MKHIDKIITCMEGGMALCLSAVFLGVGLYGYLSNNPSLETFSWGTVLISGLPMAAEAGTELVRQRRITSSLLIVMAMVASIAIGESFAAGEIAFLMALGELLELKTLSRAHRGLERLVRLEPSVACRVEGTYAENVSIEELCPGDVIRVRPGETVPTDGRIVKGTSSLDQSVLTGESLPVDVREGDSVYAASLNGEGVLDIVVERKAGDSALRKLINLVREAEKHKAPIQREADRWAGLIVPAAISISLLGYIALRLSGYSFSESLPRAITVLVVLCPCALALATPTAIMAAIGQAAQKGVMIKSGAALEELGRVSVVAFDKTGTLTRGMPEVSAVVPFGSMDESRLLEKVATVEQGSNHPLAKAVVRAVRGCPLPEAGTFFSRPDRGISAQVGNSRLFCGSEAYLEEWGMAPLTGSEKQALQKCKEQGMAVILAAAEGHCLGFVGLSDRPRNEAAGVLRELDAYRTVLLTGDHIPAAECLAKILPLSQVCAEMLPEDKVGKIRELQQNECVAMVGDGVNDAPALKAANVGIAMSHIGSDVAMSAADIALMSDDLSRLPYLFRLSEATLSSIRWNIILAIGINVLAVVCSLLGVLNPVTGALVHNAGSILVILNAARLYDRRFD